MIGIYKITNKINGKSYIGQSTNINKRINQHKYSNKSLVGKDIHKYGIENFSFDILELCSESELDEKEVYYINKFDSINSGYNISIGGKSILNEEDIKDIRLSYNNHFNSKEVYEKYKNKITYNYFMKVWEGNAWENIMPEVYTDGNKIYYMKQTSLGENSTSAEFTDEEVLQLRERYVNETAKEIYESVKNRCSFQSLQQILWGRYYSHIKYYDKKIKKWIQKII